MNVEELFCKLFPEYVVNGKPLSPYFDLFESGYEQSENRIADLEKENARLKEINTHTLSRLNLDNGELIIENEKLKKENVELKNRNQELLESCEGATMMYKDLQKANEIIKKLYTVYYDPCVTESDLKYRDELFAEIKQFLSEVEK